MEVHDNLKIKVIEARDLIAVNAIAPTAFVEVVVGSNKKYTREIPETFNPKYNDNPLIFEHILGDYIESILVYVYHKDPFAEYNRCLGLATIPMDTFYNAPKIPFDYWYDLEPTIDMLDKIEKSSIRLQITYDNSIDEDFFTNNIVVETPPPNLMQINIIGADNLPINSPIEAFVEIQAGDLKRTTKISKKSSKPSWNETLELPITDGTAYIEIALKQTLILRSVVIGRGRIPLNEVAATGETGLTKKVVLYGENYDFHEIDHGEVQLILTWIYDKATEEEATRQTMISTQRKESLFKRLKKLVRFKRSSTKQDGDENQDESRRLSGDGDELLPLRAKKETSHREWIARLGLPSDMTPNELAQYLEEQRGKRLEEIEMLLNEKETFDTSQSDMPEGDYTIQVNVIEVADLVGLNSSGLSDPIVYVEILGQKQHTKVIKEVNGAFIDEVFYFTFTNLTLEQLLNIQIKFSVYDYNWFRSSQLIGIYQVDLQNVYGNPDHEIYRHWASLRDPSNEDESGSQGLLKYSIVALGPGDSQKIHDPAMEEDDEEEKDIEVKEGAGIPDFNKRGVQNLQFLVVSLIRVDGLVGYDRLFSSVKSGLYTYIQLEFAGCQPLKTTKVAVSGKKNLSVIFEDELWIPVWVPSLCKRASLTILNREFGRKDQVIATAYVDFDSIVRCDRNPIVKAGALSGLGVGNNQYNGPSYQWIHFYGAHPSIRNGGKAVQFMNKFPSYGSAYRGSLLASFRVVKNFNANKGGYFSFGNYSTEAAHRIPIDYEIPESLTPPNAVYRLKAMIFQGIDINSKGNNSSSSGSAIKYAVGICIGNYEQRTSFRVYENNIVHWIELLDMNELILPAEYKFLPDIFITIYKGNETSSQSIAFLRMQAIDTLPSTNNKNNQQQAVWYELCHDLSHVRLNQSIYQYPGNLLMRIQLANVEDLMLDQTPSAPSKFTSISSSSNNKVPEDVEDWEIERRKLDHKRFYGLRVFVYQCKHLSSLTANAPASSSNGSVSASSYQLLNPYVKVRFNGQKKKSSVKRNTLNPCYYEVLDFHDALPHDMYLLPHVIIQLWDKQLIQNKPIGRVQFQLQDLDQIYTNLFTSDTPKPQWYDLHSIRGTDKLGSILLGFQLFIKKDLKQSLPLINSIVPTTRRCFIDIHTIGIRNLFNISPSNNTMLSTLLMKQKRVSKPSIVYHLNEGNIQDAYRIVLPSSRLPNQYNPNYLHREIMMIQLPEDKLFLPILEVFVYEEKNSTNLLGGMQSMGTLSGSVIAFAEVDLTTKLPWNTDDYIPPRHHEYYALTQELREKISKQERERLEQTIGNKRIKKKGGLLRGNTSKKDESDEKYEERISEIDNPLNRKVIEDQGVGVFPPSSTSVSSKKLIDSNGKYTDLPQIYDQEELELAQMKTKQGKKKSKENRLTKFTDKVGAGAFDWFNSTNIADPDYRNIDQDFGESSSGGHITPEIRRILDLPTTWTSSDFLRGREWWLQQSQAQSQKGSNLSNFEGTISNTTQGQELENLLEFFPFENYPLYCGTNPYRNKESRLYASTLASRKPTTSYAKQRSKNNFRSQVGILKGIIRVRVENPRLDTEYNQLFQKIKSITPVTIRLYVIRGYNLQPTHDTLTSMFSPTSSSSPSQPDPYLTVSLGDLLIKDKKIKREILSSEFFSCIELQTKFPGPGTCTLRVYDKGNMLSPFDTMIGETTIDLEDRWFHPKWTELGVVKPLEIRNLYRDNSKNSQGSLLLWVDILPTSDVLTNPAIELKGPEKLTYELRVVCWRAMDVSLSHHRMLDLYATFFMEGNPNAKQSTDTHWRCSNGKPSWNYRLKFPLELPIKSRELGRLRIQLYNRNVLKSNSIVGEAVINLYDWCLLAYRRQHESVQPFKEIKDALLKQKKQGKLGSSFFSNRANNEAVAMAAASRAIESEEEEDSEADSGEEKENIGMDSDDDNEYDDLEAGRYGDDNKDGKSNQPLLSRRNRNDNEKDKNWKSQGKKFLSAVTAQPYNLFSPAIGKNISNVTPSSAKEEQEVDNDEDESDLNGMVSTIQQYLGLGDKIAEDAEWLTLTFHDRDAGKMLNRGKIAISLSIVPESEAKSRPVGQGRDEPNVNPYLPPPLGRFSFTFNPFSLVSQLFGTRVLILLVCCLCCCCCLGIFMFISVYLSGIESVISLFQQFGGK